jgi:hypothetical protein
LVLFFKKEQPFFLKKEAKTFIPTAPDADSLRRLEGIPHPPAM